MFICLFFLWLTCHDELECSSCLLCGLMSPLPSPNWNCPDEQHPFSSVPTPIRVPAQGVLPPHGVHVPPRSSRHRCCPCPGVTCLLQSLGCEISCFFSSERQSSQLVVTQLSLLRGLKLFSCLRRSTITGRGDCSRRGIPCGFTILWQVCSGFSPPSPLFTASGVPVVVLVLCEMEFLPHVVAAS